MTSPGREAVDSRGRRYVLDEDRVVVHGAGPPREIPLDDPARPAFLDLPRVELADGTPLRREAFRTWAEHVRRALEQGAEMETLHRHARPVDAALAVGGGAAVVALCVAIVVAWARSGPDRVAPGLVSGLLQLALMGVVGWLGLRTAAGMSRAWLCRRGSFVHVDRRGIRTRKGETVRPFDVLRSARHDRFLRCTRLEFRDGEPPLWVPADPGPLERLDLVLAAVAPRLAETHPEIPGTGFQ